MAPDVPMPDDLRDGVALPLDSGLDPRQARAFVRSQAEGSGLPDDDVDRVVQLAGELIAVGVEDGGASRLAVHESGTGVVVTLDGLAWPVDGGSHDDLAAVDVEGVERARETLLDGMADGWGSAAAEDGARTWFAVERRP